MDCPVCKNAMITLELQEVEIDYCIDCGGIWLDAGELELLLGEPHVVAHLVIHGDDPGDDQFLINAARPAGVDGRSSRHQYMDEQGRGQLELQRAVPIGF